MNRDHDSRGHSSGLRGQLINKKFLKVTILLQPWITVLKLQASVVLAVWRILSFGTYSKLASISIIGVNPDRILNLFYAENITSEFITILLNLP
jgi:hypothetical protein